jgi:hypothetical protein
MLSAGNSKILVGTKGCEIFELDFKIDSNEITSSNVVPLVFGHNSDELWGLATHPTKAEFW